MKLENIFRSIAEKLKIDFEYLSSEIQHPPSKGTIREIELVEQFLTKYMPKNIGISKGEVVAKNGDVSNECDIVFFETTKCPYLLDKTGYRIFPVECIYGVVEVKSNLNSAELEKTYEKIIKLKKLPKEAYEPQTGAIIYTTTLYGQEWNFFPTLSLIFCYNSIDLIKLREKLDELQKNTPIYQRIDSIWVLNKGMIVNWDDKKGMVELTPTNNSRLRCIQSDNPLLLLTVQLQQLLQAAWMPKFRIRDYFGQINYGNFIEK